MDVFDLVAKLSLDTKEYESGLSGAESKASGFGSALSKGLGTAAKVATGAVAAAGTAVAGIAKKAVDSFGEYEQLKGGIETLFGDSAMTVLENSKKAFESAGMAQNDYMETSIQSAAALINSLEGDQAKAAELMDMSIVDMADNVNKMGTSMEGVQNAYRGFSRGNFTMLDNLALGFAGTKEGMQQLLDKAHELSGVDYNIDSYADIVQAIHVVQKEMGVAGTTAKEGTETIQGSLSQLGAAWENLVAGIANPDANLGQLIGLVIKSAETALQNLLPAIENALEGISGLIERMVPMITKRLPDLIGKILPPLLNAATSLINGLVAALPGLLQVLGAQLPGILTSLVQIIVDNLPMLIDVGLQVVTTIANGIAESLPTLIPAIVSMVMEIIQVFVSNAPMLIDAAVAIINGLVQGITSAAPVLLQEAPKLIISFVKAIVENVPKLLEAAVQIIQGLVNGLSNNTEQVVKSGVEILMAIVTGLIQAIPEIISASLQIIGAILETFASIDWLQLGGDIIAGIIAGISNGIGALVDAVKNAAQQALNAAKSFLGIQSPSKVFRDSVGKMIDMGLAEGIEGNTKYVDDAMGDLNDATSYDFSNPRFQLAGGYGIINNGNDSYDDSYGDIITAVTDALMNMQLIVNIGNKPIEAMITTAQQKVNYRSGGR